MKIIFCLWCGRETSAWMVYGASGDPADPTPRWWNRCACCHFDYATIPPGNEERKLHKRLEAAGQTRIPGA